MRALFCLIQAHNRFLGRFFKSHHFSPTPHKSSAFRTFPEVISQCSDLHKCIYVAKGVTQASQRNSRLANSQVISGTSQAKVLLGQLKTIVGTGEDIEPFQSLLSATFKAHEAIAPAASATAPAAQLMELGQPKTSGIFYIEDRRVRNIDSDLDNRGCNQDLRLPFAEISKSLVLLLAAQPPVYKTDPVFGKDLRGQVLAPRHRRGQIKLLRLLNKRINKKSLPARLQFLANEFE